MNLTKFLYDELFNSSVAKNKDLTWPWGPWLIVTNIPWVIIVESSKESHELAIIKNETVLLANLNKYAFVEIEIVTDGKVKSIEFELTNQTAAHQKTNQKQETKSWWIGIFQRYVTLRILEKQKKSACFGESLGSVW